MLLLLLVQICYSEQEMKEINPHFYLDRDKDQFVECNSDCRTCNSSTKYNCLSCNKGLSLYNGSYSTCCPERYKSNDMESNNICIDCYKNCQSCNGKGNSFYMNCDSCSNDFIRYRNFLSKLKKIFIFYIS